jgi:hypothetical protein
MRTFAQKQNQPQERASSSFGPTNRATSGPIHQQPKRLQPDNSVQTAVPPIVHEVLASPGQPLDTATRAFMEPRFGHDFSRVRVHSDSRAAESARAVNALAYTVAQDVVFGEGRYAPHTSEGRKLLVHELTHVVQQGTTTFSANEPIELSGPQDASERQADAFAAAASSRSGRTPLPSSGSGTGLQLQRADTDAGTPTTPPAPAPLGTWDPTIAFHIFLENEGTDCLGAADQDGAILYSRCGSPIEPPFCQSARSRFKVTFNVDFKFMPRPQPFKPPTVSVLFQFRTTGGLLTHDVQESDSAPRYIAPGKPLEPKFGQDFPVGTTESGKLAISLKLDDESAGVKATYDDNIEYKIKPCV